MTDSQLWQEARATTLLQMVAVPAAREPDAPALSFSRDGIQREALTWGMLWRGALVVGERLRERGLEPGSPAIVAIGTSPTFFTAFFGILAAGGVPAPIAPPASRRPSRLEWYAGMLAGIATDAGARQVVTSSDLEATLTECARRVNLPLAVVPADGISSVETRLRPRGTEYAPRPSDLALLQYTSGSTGDPRGVALTHRNIIANLGLIADAIVTPVSSAVSWLPLHHDMGLLGAALTAPLHPAAGAPAAAAGIRQRSGRSGCGRSAPFVPTITLAPNFAFAYTVRSVTGQRHRRRSRSTLCARC